MSFAFQCRTCKKQINRLSSKNLFTDGNNVILKKLEAITGIWLTEGFVMPDSICTCCLSNLDQAIEFRNRCINVNNFWLQQNVEGQSRQIKTQIDDDPLSNDKHPNIKVEPVEELSSDATKCDQLKFYDEGTDSKCSTDEDGASFDNTSNVVFHRKYMYKQFKNSCDNKSDDETVEEQLLDAFNSSDSEVDSEQSSPIVPVTHRSSSESQSSILLHKRMKRAKVKKMSRVGEIHKEMSTCTTSSTEYSPVKRTKNYFCDQCGRHFNDKANFNRHLQRHLGVKRFQCQECGHKDYSQHLVNLHNRIQHQGEKPYACKYCGERYANSMARLRHQRNHIEYLETVTIEPAFTCKLCGKTFGKKSILDAHAVVHTGEQPFCCEICNVFFNRKSSLRTHYRSKFHQENATLKIYPTTIKIK